MTTPMPKMRARVQTGSRPRATNLIQDPDEAIARVPIFRTVVGDRAGALPSEAYQYDLVFDCFARDTEFQRHWKVPKGGWSRCSTEESISQKNSYIRVVMDLDRDCKLYPTAYTPGFPTVPRDVSDEDLRKTLRSASSVKIPGLPEGYSVALDVYILKEAEILLKHQRAFRGRVDVAYRWLDLIVNPEIAAAELESGEFDMLEVTPQDNLVKRRPEATFSADNMSAGPSAMHWTWHSTHLADEASSTGGYSRPAGQANPKALQSLHEVFQPAAREELPLSCLNACPRGLKEDPGLDDVGRQLQNFRKEIHMENALINAFGDHVGLPQRDTGTSWGKEDDRGAAAALERAYGDESRLLDSALNNLWERTVNDSKAILGEASI